MGTIRIAVDGNEANVTNRVGSNVYAYEIIRHLEILTREAVEGSQIEITILLAEKPLMDLPQPRPGWQYKVIKPVKLWTQWALPIHLFLHKTEYDVFFTPGHYAPRISAIPYVSSVMDLAFLAFPDQFKPDDLLQLKNWTKYSVAKAKKVIAISEATKKEILSRYGKSSNDVIVAYPAVDMEESSSTSLKKAATLKKMDIKKPYVTYVGTLQPRKNIIKLVEAFESVKRSIASQEVKPKGKLINKLRAGKSTTHSAEKLQLVLVGKIGWLADETIQRIKESPFFSDILLTGYVSEEVKQIILREAEASVLVGLHEGFGIPPLESMQLGTIPIVSNTTSLPEVAGPAGILVDPNSHHSIADGIKKVLQLTSKGKAKYRKEMRKQVQKFSWQESAKKILSTLIMVASKEK